MIEASLAIMAAARSPSAMAATRSRPMPYVDATILEKLPFGSHSHVLQPWRSYLETVPASAFLRGTGVVLDADQVPATAIEMLARSGIANARLEIGWGEAAYANGTHLRNGEVFSRILASCRRWGIRPLILLNAHQGCPTPCLQFTRAAVSPSPAGARTIEIDGAHDLVPGKSGICNLTESWAAEVIITGMSGNRLSLSKPLPKPIAAGTLLDMATLEYEPFSVPGSDRNNATISGWLSYIDTIADFAAAALGTGDAADRGFDLEIWNELSFGTKFLSINNYYDPPLYQYDAASIWAEMVAKTAGHIAQQPARFAGVAIANGFASTVPWPASSLQPSRIAALSKHPYPPLRTFPADEQDTKNVDLRGQPSGYVPAYKAFFPEYAATAIQTETIVRDMGPITNDIYGVKHGRFARLSGDDPDPVKVWITEIGVLPRSVGITDAGAAQALKMKAALRSFLFYLQKGAERVYVYSAFGGDLLTGVLTDRFLAQARNSHVYPVHDGSYVSPLLAVLRRTVAQMRSGLDSQLTSMRQLKFAIWPNPASADQFSGDGTPENPSLRNLDALVLLPYQVNSHRFVIGYYIMTKDLLTDMAPEEVVVDIDGLGGASARLETYDPVADEQRDLRPVAARPNGVSVALVVRDTPRLLIAED